MRTRIAAHLFVYLFVTSLFKPFSLFASGNAHDWRSEVIYFTLLDRFSNGDPENDKAHGEARCNDPNNPHAFQGGDLAGLSKNLDYIQELGASSV